MPYRSTSNIRSKELEAQTQQDSSTKLYVPLLIFLYLFRDLSLLWREIDMRFLFREPLGNQILRDIYHSE